jgi:tetratricopeptide (TPR) repeat protein
MSDSAPRHPGADTMTAFLEGTLPKEEIREVADHLHGCADCRIVVSETARFVSDEEEQLVRAEPKPRRTAWLAVAAVLAIVLVAAPILLKRLASRQSPIEHLIAAAPREHRLVETRLSGFPWARLQAPVRGGAPADPADLKLFGAAGDVLSREAKRRDAEALHATGVAYLLIGDRSHSLAALQKAAEDSPDAKSWNDLAAALFASAEEDLQPQKLADALAAADHALRLDPKNAEALFNRALITERIGAGAEARKAWQQYLDVDPHSGWSVEAREHLRRLAPHASLHFDLNGGKQTGRGRHDHARSPSSLQRVNSGT